MICKRRHPHRTNEGVDVIEPGTVGVLMKDSGDTAATGRRSVYWIREDINKPDVVVVYTQDQLHKAIQVLMPPPKDTASCAIAEACRGELASLFEEYMKVDLDQHSDAYGVVVDKLEALMEAVQRAVQEAVPLNR